MARCGGNLGCSWALPVGSRGGKPPWCWAGWYVWCHFPSVLQHRTTHQASAVLPEWEQKWYIKGLWRLHWEHFLLVWAHFVKYMCYCYSCSWYEKLTGFSKLLIRTELRASSAISHGFSFHTWAAMLYSSINGSYVTTHTLNEHTSCSLVFSHFGKVELQWIISWQRHLQTTWEILR